MRSSKTCVILVNYRGSVDTAACVRSLLGSLTPVDVVVIDTTPNDPELEAALNFAPEVVIIRAANNLGFGGGNNIGIDWALHESSCEYLLLLNNDTVIEPTSILALEDAMHIQSEVGMMTPRIAYLDCPEILWYGGGEIDWRRASAYTPGCGGSITSDIAMTERDISFATGCAIFLRRSVAEKLRGFDPRFFMYEEDVELCLRARKSNIRIRYIPQSLIFHRAQGSTRGHGIKHSEFWSVHNPNLTFYAFHIMRNRVLNIRLHARGRNRITAILFFPLYFVRRAIPFLLGGRVDAIIAMLGGIADARHVYAKAGFEL